MPAPELTWQSASAPTYPRPDFVHDGTRFALLDGPWAFLFDDDNQGIAAGWGPAGIPAQAGQHAQRSIRVPYAFQSPASGINAPYEAHEHLWYQRTFRLPADAHHPLQHTTLHFGAVDYECSVFLDGTKVGAHRGGHVPFSVPITPYLHASPEHEYRLTLYVRDSPTDLTQPRGKQYWVLDGSASIFYTPTSGIWQSVWIEQCSLKGAGLLEGAAPPRIQAQHTVLRTDVSKGQLLSSVAVEGTLTTSSDLFAAVKVSLAGVSLGSSSSVKISSASSAPEAAEAGASTKQVALLSHSLVLDADAQSRLPASFQEAHPLASTTCAVLKQWREARKQGSGTAPLLKQAAWSDNGVALWSPLHPLLYDVELKLFDSTGTVLDLVHTTVGARTIEWAPAQVRRVDGHEVQPKGGLLLNGLPYFHCLMLDQGYWLETNLTPPDDGAVGGTAGVNTGLALKRDIELGKEMGFDGVRKHQKVEDPRFLYWADRLGYLVWGEFANAYEWSETYADRIEQEWREAVQRDRNHACIVAWTPVNESWAYTDLEQRTDEGALTALALRQREHIGHLVRLTKSLDPTRPVNDNCGWQHVAGDLASFHDYSDAPALYETCRRLVPGTAGQSAILAAKDEGRRGMFVPCPGTAHDTLAGATFEGLALPRGYVPGMPVINTEFGGINISGRAAAAAHVTGRGGGPEKDGAAGKSGLDLGIGGDYSGSEWGYTTASSAEDLLARIRRTALALVGVSPSPSSAAAAAAAAAAAGVRGQEGFGATHLCGMVYTQHSDCEQEVNGLLTNDRTMKLPARDTQAVLDDLRRTYFASVGDWV